MDLIKGRVDVVSKLNFCNRRGTLSGQTNSKTNNTLLTKRRVEYPFTTYKYQGELSIT